MNHPEAPLEAGDLIIKAPGTFTYVAHGWAGGVLYVGITDDLCTRMAQHRRDSLWWPDAARVTWELWESRRSATRREAELIRDLEPEWNVHMNGERRRPRYDDEAWARLGETVRRHREKTRQTQTSLARDAGWGVGLLRALERAERPDVPLGALEALEEALSWAQGSAEAILNDGRPTPLTTEERTARAHAAARSFLEGQGR